MQAFYDWLWRLDYPINLLMGFLVFFLPLSKKKNWLIYGIIGLICLIAFWQIISIPDISDDSFFVIPIYIGMFVIMLGIIYFTIDIDLKGALFILSCVVSAQHITYCITLGIINFININLFHSNWYLLVNSLSMIVVYLPLYFFFSTKLHEDIEFTNIYLATISIILIILIEVVFSISQMQIFLIQDLPNRLFVTTSINLSNLIFTILIILFLYLSAISQRRKEENLATSLIKQKERERFEMAKVTINEINIKYHDLKHMLTDDKINEEDKKEIQETITNYKAIIQTNNVGLNVVIYEAQLKCIELGIDFNVLLDGDYFDNFKAHHIYSLFSNLLDNSIEATSKINDMEKKRISLNIKLVRDSIVIILKNYFVINPKFKKGIPLTTKKDQANHGYGMKSIQRIVKLYGGAFTVSTNKDVFSIKIIFPYLSKSEK